MLHSEGPPSWSSLDREDMLNLNLETHPHWVVKAPGTFDTTNRRDILFPPPAHPPFAAPFAGESQLSNPDWKGRCIVAHSLDGNPVEDGMRRLSPARRRHNGGVGYD